VADLAFISLKGFFPVLCRMAPGAQALLLVKPQFEVGRGKVGKGGVVRDMDLREEAIQGVIDHGKIYGAQLQGRFPCPIHGPKGNKEEWTWWKVPG